MTQFQQQGQEALACAETLKLGMKVNDILSLPETTQWSVITQMSDSQLLQHKLMYEERILNALQNNFGQESPLTVIRTFFENTFKLPAAAARELDPNAMPLGLICEEGLEKW